MEASRTIKAIKLDLHQPTAHYREPRILQDSYVPTLMLPPKTTIAGMLTYIADRRLDCDFKIGVIGTHSSKSLHFTRGEGYEHWSNYRKLIKDKNEKDKLLNGEYYKFYKDKKAKNRIINYEVLNDVKLTIFFTCDNENEYNHLKESLQHMRKYLSLGRKEDFAVPQKKGVIFEEVDIEENVFIKKKRAAVIEKLKLKNTYVEVDLRDMTGKYDGILSQGVLYSIPKEYYDKTADKKDRIMKHSHYVHLGNEGVYPSNLEVNVYRDKNKDENIVFTWL